MSDQYDILVIGDDEASLCAAAAAAKSGQRVAHLRGEHRRRLNAGASIPPIPNFVWRRLDLQDYDLAIEPVSARVSLLKDGETISTYANPRETREALEEKLIEDHLVWDDFTAESAALMRAAPINESGLSVDTPFEMALATMLTDTASLDVAMRVFGSCEELVDDYLCDDRLKGHVTAHVLSVAGASSQEAGSARLAAEFFNEEAWRVKTPKDATGVMSVLEEVCKDAGVKMISGAVKNTSPGNAKNLLVDIGAEDKIRTRFIFFATPEAARNAGAQKNGSPRASFTARFKMSDRLDPPAGDGNAVYQVLDDVDDIKSASDCAVRGKLSDSAPIEFEFTPEGDIVAHTAYFPAAFYEDGEWRGWTGQDRQAAAAIVKNRIASRLPDFASSVRRTETEAVTPPIDGGFFDGVEQVIIQPHRHNAIGAAVRLIDKVLLRDD